jgi:hypothetical protein
LKKLVDFLEIPLKSEFKYEMTSSKQIIIEILCHCLKQHEYENINFYYHLFQLSFFLDQELDTG